MFYDPSCNFCNNENVNFEFNMVAKSLRKSTSTVKHSRVFKIDAKKNLVLTKRLGIKRFPTFILFSRKSQFIYNGDRNKKDMFNWLRDRTGSPSFMFTTEKVLNVLKGENQLLLVFYGTNVNDPDFKSYYNVAQEMKNGLYFAHTFTEELVNNAPAKVVMYKQFENGQVKLE